MRSPPSRLVLLGHPVAHSLSPTFQNAALRAAGIPLTYEAMDVAPADLKQTLATLVRENAAGNVTIPHKETVANACGRLTPLAKRVGAVNTFAMRDGVLVGDNTDVLGFTAAMHVYLGQKAGMTVGLFGAGGAAAAVLATLELWSEAWGKGISAIVVNRDPDRAEALAARFRSLARVGDANEVADRADLVVNATSLGMADGAPGPIDPARLRKATAVLDLVYRPNETAFVHAARERGLRAADGLEMLIAQGAAAFGWWFGRKPDLEVMWRAVNPTRRQVY